MAPGSSSGKPLYISLNTPYILDPFFVVRCRPPGFYQDITVHRSNVIKNNLNPEWNSFELAIETVRGLDTEFEGDYITLTATLTECLYFIIFLFFDFH